MIKIILGVVGGFLSMLVINIVDCYFDARRIVRLAETAKAKGRPDVAEQILRQTGDWFWGAPLRFFLKRMLGEK